MRGIGAFLPPPKRGKRPLFLSHGPFRRVDGGSDKASVDGVAGGVRVADGSVEREATPVTAPGRPEAPASARRSLDAGSSAKPLGSKQLPTRREARGGFYDATTPVMSGKRALSRAPSRGMLDGGSVGHRTDDCPDAPSAVQQVGTSRSSYCLLCGMSSHLALFQVPSRMTRMLWLR